MAAPDAFMTMYERHAQSVLVFFTRAEQIPVALRGPTLALNARLIRLDTHSRAPEDVVCIEFHAARSGGGTCGVTAAQIEAGARSRRRRGRSSEWSPTASRA